MKLRIGSRESALAVAQARILIDYLERTGHTCELVTMKTTGDMILDRPLNQIGGKGLFVKELDTALLAGAVDLTVHSFKDMPPELNEKLPIVAVSKREDARDVLILPRGESVLQEGKPIGCSSARRTVQLARLYPEMSVAPLRGNIVTRLKKLDEGGYSAIVLAYAGIKRLGLTERVSRVFTPEEMIPAACQGILAVQARSGFDAENILGGFNDPEAFSASLAERAFTAALGGGCTLPIAAYAVCSGDKITLTGMYADDAGGLHNGVIEGERKNAEQIGRELALKLKGELV